MPGLPCRESSLASCSFCMSILRNDFVANLHQYVRRRVGGRLFCREIGILHDEHRACFAIIDGKLVHGHLVQADHGRDHFLFGVRGTVTRKCPLEEV